jgi:hypothetical protein
VELEITPEPTPEERRALQLALAALAARNGATLADGRGAWWRRGQLEALGEEPELDDWGP